MEILISLKNMEREDLAILEKEIVGMILTEWGTGKLRTIVSNEKDDLLEYFESLKRK